MPGWAGVAAETEIWEDVFVQVESPVYSDALEAMGRKELWRTPGFLC